MKPVRFAIVIALLAAGMGAAVAHANLNSSSHSNDEALIRRIDALWSNAAQDKDLEGGGASLRRRRVHAAFRRAYRHGNRRHPENMGRADG